jgi:hypothetical protein
MTPGLSELLRDLGIVVEWAVDDLSGSGTLGLGGKNSERYAKALRDLEAIKRYLAGVEEVG